MNGGSAPPLVAEGEGVGLHARCGARAQGAKDELGLERAGVREEVGDGGGRGGRSGWRLICLVWPRQC